MKVAAPRALMIFIGVAFLALAANLGVALYFTANPGYRLEGPASESHARANVAPATVMDRARTVGFYLPDDTQREALFSQAPDGPIWVVYDYSSVSGSRVDVTAIDANTLLRVNSYERLRDSGAYQLIGQTKTTADWVTSALALLGIVAASSVWGWGHFVRTVRAGWSTSGVWSANPIVAWGIVVMEVLVCFVGFALPWLMLGWTRAKKMVVVFRHFRPGYGVRCRPAGGPGCVLGSAGSRELGSERGGGHRSLAGRGVRAPSGQSRGGGCAARRAGAERLPRAACAARRRRWSTARSLRCLRPIRPGELTDCHTGGRGLGPDGGHCAGRPADLRGGGGNG